MRRPAIPLGAVVLAAAPFVFAAIRAANARHDLRMLWMALAALAGAAAVGAIGRPRGSVLARAVLVLLLGTALAARTGYRLGATAAAGVWPVAFVLALCFAVAYALFAVAQK
jgi:hypothetical protein